MPHFNSLQQQLKTKDDEIRQLKNELSKLKSAYAIADIYITHDNDAQDSYHQSILRLSATISNLNEGILLEDEHRKIVLTNHVFCTMFNIPVAPENMVGADCSDSAEQSKVYFKNESAFVERIEKLLKNKKTVIGDELELKDGRILKRDFITITTADKYIGHLWKYLDITEQKDAEEKLKRREEKYRGIIANMNLGLLEVDNDEHIMFANQSFCDITGYNLEELLGAKASSFLLEDGLANSMDEINSLRTKGISSAYNIRIKDKFGNYKWMLISGAPLYDDEKVLIGSIGIHLDITDQKILENELIESKKIAEESSKAKQMFLANMSHEIRTPMNAILGMSKLLTKTMQNGQQKIYTDAIIQSAENLIVIINDILDFSKIEAGHVQIENIGFKLSAVVNQLESVLKYKTEEKGLEFDTVVSAHIPDVLIGDPYRINQVLLNLVGNSIKFTEKGGIELWCKLLESEAGACTIMFTVKDTGIGIDAEYLKHLCKDFTQEDASITRKYGGTGLGLSISKRLINLMGGQMTIESTKGIGTTISFVLTMPQGTLSDMPASAVPLEELNGDNRELIDRKILLVEDNQFNRLLASTILIAHGAEVVEAENGKIAIELAARQKFDLVVMDVQMPVMNGFEATQHIRNVLQLQVPIIALTANAVKGEDVKCFEAGMNEFITKPFVEEHLIKTICALLKQPEPAKAAGAPQIMPEPQPVALYSLETLQKTAGADTEFLNRMVKTFFKQGDEAIANIAEAVNNRDMVKIKALVHKIKPSINYLKMEAISQIILKMQNWNAGFDDEFIDYARTLSQKLAQVVEVMKAEINL